MKWPGKRREKLAWMACLLGLIATGLPPAAADSPPPCWFTVSAPGDVPTQPGDLLNGLSDPMITAQVDPSVVPQASTSTEPVSNQGQGHGEEPSDMAVRGSSWEALCPEACKNLEGAIPEEEQAEPEHQGLLKNRLHGRGPVAFEYVYTGEIMTNARGGIRTRNATQYEGLFDLAMRVDLEKTRLPVPGQFFLLFQQTHGRGLSMDFVGDAQIVSTIDSFDNITQVSEYGWEASFGEEFLTIRLGKQDVNSEFHCTEIAADFVHSAYGIPPTLPGPTYPDNSAAAVLLVKLSQSLMAKAGIWDGYPNGATWGFSGTGITFTIAELEYSYTLFRRLPGIFDIGFSHRSPIDVVPEEFTSEQYTLYWDFEQALYREDFCDDKNEQGLTFFARYGTAYPRPEVEFKDYFSVGFVYQGLIPGRDEDRIGAGVNYLRHNLGGTGTEIATEVFYKAQVKPWAFVQPTIQFISSPSGIYRDSLVIGVRFQIVL